MRRLALALLLLAACKAEPDLPAAPRARQVTLAERILGRATKLAKADPGEVGDCALALSEVVDPTQAPRLRLLVAGDDERLARGAAEALVRIRLVRGGADGKAVLEECAAHESNELVRSACFTQLAIHSNPGPFPPPSTRIDHLVSLLDSGEPEARRQGLRELLRDAAFDRVTESRLESRLVHLLDDSDERVRLLDGAVWLRRSLLQSPPPDPGVGP